MMPISRAYGNQWRQCALTPRGGRSPNFDASSDRVARRRGRVDVRPRLTPLLQPLRLAFTHRRRSRRSLAQPLRAHRRLDRVLGVPGAWPRGVDHPRWTWRRPGCHRHWAIRHPPAPPRHRPAHHGDGGRRTARALPSRRRPSARSALGPCRSCDRGRIRPPLQRLRLRAPAARFVRRRGNRRHRFTRPRAAARRLARLAMPPRHRYSGCPQDERSGSPARA